MFRPSLIKISKSLSPFHLLFICKRDPLINIINVFTGALLALSWWSSLYTLHCTHKFLWPSKKQFNFVFIKPLQGKCLNTVLYIFMTRNQKHTKLQSLHLHPDANQPRKSQPFFKKSTCLDFDIYGSFFTYMCFS